MVKRFFIWLLIVILVIAVAVGLTAVSINSYVQHKEKDNIVSAITENKDSLMPTEIKTLKKLNADCILVLGAGIKDEETPTPMLKDRLDVGIMLYNADVAPKILLSGDNGTVEHNEIHVMLKYVLNAGVPAKDIFCDHAGFSTYDSMYRAGSIFKVKSLIIVTQTYHEYRSLYVAEKLGLKAKGVASDQMTYSGQAYRELREVLARDKDFFKVISKPDPLIGGSEIPITGNGKSTHGE